MNVKYFDHANQTFIDIEMDGCKFSNWKSCQADYPFAVHPKGFPIFLSANDIEANDEYAITDPYSVADNKLDAFHRRRIELTLDMVRDAVSEKRTPPRILDLGCGQGHITEEIRRANPEAEVSGLDYSVSAIEYAHEKFPEIDFAVGDAYKNPYSEAYFDVIICNNLWEHVPDPLSLLSRMKLILKDQGFIVISTPSRYRTVNLIRVLLGRPVIFMSDHHVTEYTVGQIKEQLSFGGFSVQAMSSRPLESASLKSKFATALLRSVLSLVGSHHMLEATVFYLVKPKL